MGRTGFLGRATHLERALFWEVSAPRRPRWRSHTSAGAVLRWDRQSGLRLSPDQPVGVGVGLRGSGARTDRMGIRRRAGQHDHTTVSALTAFGGRSDYHGDMRVSGGAPPAQGSAVRARRGPG